MSKEFDIPEPRAILKGILASGRTLEQFAAMGTVISTGIENGTIRNKISCWEHREQFFEMADRVYVKNGKVELKDAEAGIHEGQCRSPICLRLTQAYFETLKPSTEEQSEEIRDFLVGLRKELVTGREIKELKGKPGGFSDSSNNPMLIEKAVDISHLCQGREGDESRLTYYSDHGGPGVRFSKKNKSGSESIIFYQMAELRPDDLVYAGELMGIDGMILHEVVHVNSPERK